MKIIHSLAVLLSLITISFTVKATDPCVGTTQTIFHEQGFEWYAYYHSPTNYDGTIPPNHYSGSDLIITFDKAGPVTILRDITNPDGTITIPYTINVINCLNISNLPTFLCNGNSQGLTLTDSNGSTTYNWTAPTGWSLNGGGNTLTTSSTAVTITAANPSVQGHNLITVTSDNSGNRTFDIWVGAPNAGLYRIYPSGLEHIDPVTLTAGGTYTFYADPPPGATTYTWTLPTGFTWGTGSHTASQVNIKVSSASNSFVLTCSASNSCGSSAMHNLHITTSGSGGGRDKIMAMNANVPVDIPYPTPVNENININLSQPSVISLINFQGTIVRQMSVEGATIISTDDLNSGVYVVKLQNQDGLKQFRITIQK